MKQKRIVFGLVLCAVMMAIWIGTAAETPGPVSDEAGFVAMFNGKDFAGWHFGTDSYAMPTNVQKTWKVEDGVIKQGKGSNKPNLISQWDYEDFELRLEWRAPADKSYNSGVFIRCARNNERDNQLNLKQGDEGNYVPTKLAGAKPLPDLLKPQGEWNEWRVTVVGDKVTMVCNGKPGWEASGFKSKTGYIGLQAEYFPFEFRNIRVKEIGWEPLNELSKWNGNGWKLDGDALVSGGSKDSLESKAADLGEYQLRLEWRTGKDNAKGSVGLRGAKAAGAILTLGAGENDGLPGHAAGKNADNPAGQWNYLDAKVTKGGTTITLNGVAIAENIALDPQTGGIGLSPTLEYRNIRVKRLSPK